MSRYYEKVGEVSSDFVAHAIVISRHCEGWQESRGDNTAYAATFEGRKELEQLSELTDRWPADIW